MQKSLEKMPAVSHRDHPLRRLQNYIENRLPEILDYLHRREWLNGTKMAEVLKKGEELLPDHITLSGLKLTIESARALALSGMSIQQLSNWALGNLLDAADGVWARRLGVASVVGAMKDAAIDRLSENYIARLITKNRKMHGGDTESLEKQLCVAFQLSTLTKAACEMTGVRTSEGGQGGMMERRWILLKILFNFGQLNSQTILKSISMSILHPWQALRQNFSPNEKLLRRIDSNINFLIAGSYEKAQQRVAAIAASENFGEFGWENPALNDPTSPAATEASKYVAIILMNEKGGLDVLEHLQTLHEGVVFPTPEELMAKYSYITARMHEADDFLQQANGIVAEVGD